LANFYHRCNEAGDAESFLVEEFRERQSGATPGRSAAESEEMKQTAALLPSTNESKVID